MEKKLIVIGFERATWEALARAAEAHLARWGMTSGYRAMDYPAQREAIKTIRDALRDDGTIIERLKEVTRLLAAAQAKIREVQ